MPALVTKYLTGIFKYALFRKRTMNGIHLIKHNETGVTIQFYAILIVALLQLKLNQDAVFQKDREEEQVEIEDSKTEADLPNSSQECEKGNDSQSAKPVSAGSRLTAGQVFKLPPRADWWLFLRF